MAYSATLKTQTGRKPWPVTAVYPETGLPQKRREPDKFLKILNSIAGGAIAGGAAGIGSLVGELIGGTSRSMYGSYRALYEQPRRPTDFPAVSNLLKTRHDSEMTAVNNIKF